MQILLLVARFLSSHILITLIARTTEAILVHHKNIINIDRKHGRCSSESTRLSPMLPEFKPCWTYCCMWIELFVSSHLCFEGFSLGSPVILPPKNQFSDSNRPFSNLLGWSPNNGSKSRLNLIFYLSRPTSIWNHCFMIIQANSGKVYSLNWVLDLEGFPST